VVKAALRGWFREFVGAECAEGYLGPARDGELAAWRALRRRSFMAGIGLAVTALATTSAPLSSRPAEVEPPPLVQVSAAARYALDEALAERAAAPRAGAGLGLPVRYLRLDTGLGAYSGQLLALGLAER
jgi:hypothetical protein